MSAFVFNDETLASGPNQHWSSQELIPDFNLITVNAGSVVFDITKGFPYETSINFFNEDTTVILINNFNSATGADILVPHRIRHLLIRDQSLRFTRVDSVGFIIKFASGTRVVIPGGVHPRLTAINCMWDMAGLDACDVLRKVRARMDRMSFSGLRLCRDCITQQGLTIEEMCTFISTQVESVTFDTDFELCSKHSLELCSKHGSELCPKHNTSTLPFFP